MNKAYLVKRTDGNVLSETKSFLITPEKVLLGPNGNVISVINPDNLEEKVNKTDISFKDNASKLKKILINGEKYRVKVYQDRNIVQVVPYDNKFSQWGKQGIATISLLASMLLFYACPNPSRPNGDDNGPTPSYGDLSGTVKGLIKKGLINDVTVSLPNTNYSATTDANGNFEIKSIENPSNYKRIRLRSNNIIDRETNISLGIGENVANIDVIEGDNISGFNYEDYLTVNRSGARIVSNIPLRHHFFNESVWEWDGSKYVKIGTLESLKAEPYTDALAKITDVYTNDFPPMTLNLHTDKKIYLESKGEDGPPSINRTDIENNHWFVSCISKGINELRTAFYTNSKNEIIGARLRIPFFKKQPLYSRGAYLQDICEWAGFVDNLKKSFYSIFAETGFMHDPHLYPFDKDYAAVIKYSRLPGHGPSGDIPDYDPEGSGSNVYVVNFIPRSSGQDYTLGFKTPFDEPNSTKQFRRDYREWLRREGIILKNIDERKLRKNLEKREIR